MEISDSSIKDSIMMKDPDAGGTRGVMAPSKVLSGCCSISVIVLLLLQKEPPIPAQWFR